MITISAEKLARAGYTYVGRLYTEMDCQAFVEKCLADCGMKINLAGSNAWYRKMNWTGTPEECKKQFGRIPVGAFLYIWDNDGKEPGKYRGDGIGNASHIGIYTNIGAGAIHSSASRGCVIESRFSGKTINGGWNRVGLWENVEYAEIDMNRIRGKDGGNKIGNEEKSGMNNQAMVVLPSGAQGSTVNLREGPSRDKEIMLHVPVGALVDVVEDNGKWCKVAYAGKTGYMMANYLEYQGQGGESIGEGMTTEDRSRIDLALRNAEALLIQVQDQLEIIGGIVGRG